VISKQVAERWVRNIQTGKSAWNLCISFVLNDTQNPADSLPVVGR
jgi:hypothetical protein